MKVLVCIASRDRPQMLAKSIDSILSTSANADVAVYVDEDQWDEYKFIGTLSRVKFICSEQKGPVYSLNALCDMFPGYAAYGAATDDCEFVTQGWDRWVLDTIRDFPKGIGCLSPHSGAHGRMDFPWVSAEWLRLVGYLANPGCYHYYWDVGMEILAEQTCIARATREDFSILHDGVMSPNLNTHLLSDARAAILWCAFDRPMLLKRLQEAIHA